jgi:hypothetical protein
MDFIINILKFMIQDKASFVDIGRIKIFRKKDYKGTYRFNVSIDKKYFEENK